MNSTTKFLFCFLLSAFCFLQLSTFAQGGTTGPLTWSINNNTLIISGNGEMPDYYLMHDDSGNFYSNIPWFPYRESIYTIILETGVTSIGKEAFTRCKQMISVTLPGSITAIGSLAFYGCSGLTSVTIPNGVIRIEPLTFNFCTNLTTLTLPESLTYIDVWAFDWCTSLALITSLNPVPPIVDNFTVFGQVNLRECILQVPMGSVSAYKNDLMWKYFSNIVGIDVGIESIEPDVVKVYPNPTTGELTITNYELRITSVEIYDIYGKKLSHYSLLNTHYSVDISHLQTGLYFAKITTEKGVITKKIIKQ